MYHQIVNPKTGRKININSKKGRYILQQYINLLMVGGLKNTAMMSYGRFQPPHLSHSKLIDLIIEKSKIENADAYLFASQKDNNFADPKNVKSFLRSKSEKVKKKLSENPIKIIDKLDLLNRLHHEKAIHIVNVVEENIDNPVSAVRWLIDKGYTKIIFFAGTDRFNNFKGLFDRLNTTIEESLGISDLVEVRELYRSEEALSATEIRKLILTTTYQIIDKFEEINNFAKKIAPNELNELSKIIKLYSKIKGKDVCYKNLTNIYQIFEDNISNSNCEQNFQIVKDIIHLVQEGIEIPDTVY